VTLERFASFDGTQLAVHTLGEGRPVVLLHGLFSSAQMNWIKWGHAARLAAAGFRAIMLDFRVHGESDAPRDPNAYPTGVLVRDVAALAEHFALEPGGFDLVGFSLGARTTVRMLAYGAAPYRVILSGMGSDGTLGLRAIKEKAGAVFIQTPDQAKFDGMPRSAVDDGHLQEVIAAAHTLRGVISNFHARPSVDALMTLERTATEGDLETLAAGHAHACSEVERAAAALREAVTAIA
jgi:pimeloyl-ACP methyl ester carboxylesterase